MVFALQCDVIKVFQMNVGEVKIHDGENEHTEVAWDSCQPSNALLLAHGDLLLAHLGRDTVEELVSKYNTVAKSSKGDQHHEEEEHLSTSDIVLLRHDLMNDEHDAIGTQNCN